MSKSSQDLPLTPQACGYLCPLGQVVQLGVCCSREGYLSATAHLHSPGASGRVLICLLTLTDTTLPHLSSHEAAVQVLPVPMCPQAPGEDVPQPLLPPDLGSPVSS